MSKEPLIAMENANFTLICSDGKKLKVNREKLCAFSKVFAELLGMEVDGDSETCGVVEKSTDMVSFLKMIEGSYSERHTWKKTIRLIELADKYDCWAVTCAVKMNLWRYISKDQATKGNAETYRAASKLNDDDLASCALAFGNVLFEDGDDHGREWEERAERHLQHRTNAIQKLLLSVGKEFGNTGCEKKHHLMQKVLVDAMNLGQTSPGCTPAKLFLQAFEPHSTTCQFCLNTILLIMKRLEERWPAIEQEWKQSF